MYTVSELVELGEAQDLILGLLKDWFMLDDISHLTMAVEPPW